MLARLRALTSALFQRRQFEEAMRNEIEFHLASYTDDLVKRGVSRAEAERRARMEFGTVDALKDDCRQSRGLRLFDEAWQDLRYAARLIRKAPTITIAAIVSLALGIGANTAIFTLMDAVLLRTVPVADPATLFFLAHGDGDLPSTSSNYPLFERYEQLTEVFSGVTAFSTSTFKVPTGESTENVDGMWVNGTFHSTLGVSMALGRGFASEPDREPGGSRIAVLSDRYWARRFGRSPDALGRTLSVDGVVVSIVGVTTPEFVGLVPGQVPDITLPLSMKTLSQADFLSEHGTWTSMPILARLKPGISSRRALAVADVAFRQYMSEPENVWITKRDPDAFRGAQLIEAGRGSSGLRQRYGMPLTVLMTLVGLILLIATTNVANLLLVRSEARSKEIAVRLCVGCGRLRLIRQLLTESLLLSLCGAALGFLLAQWGTNAIMAFVGALETPIILDVSPSARVLAFTTIVSVLTGLLFGLAPALRSTRVDLTPALKGGSVVAASHRRRWTTGEALLVSQLAVCVLVITVAGLLVRSLYNLKNIDAGFKGERVLAFTLDAYGTGLEEGRRGAVYAEVLDRLKARPGVTAASASRSTPIHTSGNSRALDIPGASETVKARGAWTNIVTPGYFETLGIRLIRGRDFSALDSGDSQKVAIINQTLATFFYGDADPIGQTFAFQSTPDRLTVVGVAEDTYQTSLREPVPRMVYTPLTQSDMPSRMTFEVRTEQPPVALAAAVRGIVGGVTKDAVLHYVRTMDDQINASLVRERLLASLSTGFALLALVLAAVGLYGVMSYQVSRQSREIGIRIALGAVRRVVVWQVLRQVLTVSVAGIVLGVGAGLIATRHLSTLLFGLSPTDPTTFVAVVVLLLTTAVVAGLLPARRAAAMDPVRAIKTE